jgi:ATP-dependent protease Clp ATPase subunit
MGSDALVELIDIVPTLLEVTGLPTPERMQGRSLVPILSGHADPSLHRDIVRTEYYSALGKGRGGSGKTYGTMTRDAQYKLVVYHGHDAGELFAQVLPEDLVKFGMIPEFIGRLPTIGAVRSLDAESLVRILTEPKNALVRQYQKVFEFEDVEREFDQEGLQAVADLALLRGTGARGLRAILEEVLLNTMYDLPGRTDIGRVVIDEKTVREKTNPTLVPRQTARAARPRRAAS